MLLLWLLPLLAPAQSPGETSVLVLTTFDHKLPSSSVVEAACRQQGVAGCSLYRWQNHLYVYGPAAGVAKLPRALHEAYPKAGIKLYAAPFYRFDRRRCTDQGTAGQWTNILLTAQLVADTVKQNEYMQYHATQFEQWPEVSQGFCNARFQQLLLFRQGRRLLLVISIPKGTTLAELNPLTTRNNPRVDEWNRRMSQYQEGLPGTRPGEVWVFPQPVPPLAQPKPVRKQRGL
ncbi:L-rhamnose mutarotase [Hymenobacter gummosus]|uniref:L-rhamnose mutarotase n=1 Tax=Hymenobacter gummosus TaxID=1776032 RepID=UPI001FB1F4BB|nr:L-rhamnose mutarotase [Hymenobacter gummosus]